MDKDNRLKILINTLSFNSNILIFEGPLKIDGIKNIKVSDNKKDELKKYIKNVFQYTKTLVTKDSYKYNDTLDYDTYISMIKNPSKYTLTDLLEAYVILSDEYNNTSWTNFCCNNVTGNFNIFCNNSTRCDHCVYCNDCNDCNDCNYCNNCNDCIKCTRSNDCNTCNECTCINNKNNRYKINN